MKGDRTRLLAEKARTSALDNSARLLRASRLIYEAPYLQPIACTLLALAHEELGKAILYRVASEGMGDLGMRLENADGSGRRPLVDDHSGKFELAVGAIVHSDLEHLVLGAFEVFLHRALTHAEARQVGAFLLANRTRQELTEEGALSSLYVVLGKKRAETLVRLVEEMDDLAKAEYDDLSAVKLRGLYVDVSPGTEEVLTPNRLELPDFRYLASELETAIAKQQAPL